MQDLPLVFNYNLTLGSGGKNLNRSDYYIGAGFGFHQNHYTAAKEKGTMTGQINGVGPLINAGFRLVPNKEGRNSIEFRFSYMLLLQSSHTQICSFGLIMNF
jgi:hypothetical protein